jgi:hypothetical protein
METAIPKKTHANVFDVAPIQETLSHSGPTIKIRHKGSLLLLALHIDSYYPDHPG